MHKCVPHSRCFSNARDAGALNFLTQVESVSIPRWYLVTFFWSPGIVELAFGPTFNKFNTARCVTDGLLRPCGGPIAARGIWMHDIPKMRADNGTVHLEKVNAYPWDRKQPVIISTEPGRTMRQSHRCQRGDAARAKGHSRSAWMKTPSPTTITCYR